MPLTAARTRTSQDFCVGLKAANCSADFMIGWWRACRYYALNQEFEIELMVGLLKSRNGEISSCEAAFTVACCEDKRDATCREHISNGVAAVPVSEIYIENRKVECSLTSLLQRFT